MRNSKARAALTAAILAAAVGSAGPARAETSGPTGAAVSGAAGALVRTVEGDPALGEYLSGECVTCHQLSGNYDGIPAIVGWPAIWLVDAMNEFKARKRPNPVMQTIAARYSAEEIAALAVYFESVIKHPPR